MGPGLQSQLGPRLWSLWAHSAPRQRVVGDVTQQWRTESKGSSRRGSDQGSMCPGPLLGGMLALLLLTVDSMLTVECAGRGPCADRGVCWPWTLC